MWEFGETGDRFGGLPVAFVGVLFSLVGGCGESVRVIPWGDGGGGFVVVVNVVERRGVWSLFGDVRAGWKVVCGGVGRVGCLGGIDGWSDIRPVCV